MRTIADEDVMSNQPKYNPQIHHRKSIRLKDHDYSRDGLYFITICCKNKECLFGEIQREEMILNEYGAITNHCWLHIPEHFPDAILHTHIVMPNHIHGIIEIAQPEIPYANVGAENFQPLHHAHRNQFQKMIPRSVGSIVKGFKIGVTKWFRENTDIETVWQRNYYEHIIRNEQDYRTIAQYIRNNPSRWNDDKFYK